MKGLAVLVVVYNWFFLFRMAFEFDKSPTHGKTQSNSELLL
jgi:hypothetical protein